METKMERNKKLELLPNTPVKITLLNNQPKIGNNSYGEWYLYNLLNGDGVTEYSYFAPQEVHDELKNLKQGTKAVITKLVANRNNKVVTTYAVEVEKEAKEVDMNGSMPNQTNPYLDMMIQSFEDALIIQEKYNGMANINQLSITMFIQRCKEIEFKK